MNLLRPISNHAVYLPIHQKLYSTFANKFPEELVGTPSEPFLFDHPFHYLVEKNLKAPPKGLSLRDWKNIKAKEATNLEALTIELRELNSNIKKLIRLFPTDVKIIQDKSEESISTPNIGTKN